MTRVEMLKAANRLNLLKAVAKPLLSMGSRTLRTGGEFMDDAAKAFRGGRPGRPTAVSPGGQPMRTVNGPPSGSHWAGKLDDWAQQGDAHRAGMGWKGRSGVTAARGAAFVAPFAAAAYALPPWMMPVWSTATNVGHAAGQGANWALRPENTRQMVTQGGQDAMIGINDYMQGQSFADRRNTISQFNQGQGYTPRPPASFGGSARQLMPGGQGDMSDWLMRHAQSVRAQQQKQGMQKAAMARALWGAAKPLLKKWAPRAAKGVAVTAPIPLGIGAVQGWMGADDAASGVGADMAVNEFQKRMQKAGPASRFALAADPTLMLGEANRQMPGLYDRYHQTHGQALDRGWMSQLRDGWNSPSFLASDSAGSYSIPNSSRPT